MNRTDAFQIQWQNAARPGQRQLPAMAMCQAAAVSVRVEDLVIPTYLPAPPDKNPMFLEKRVYQGSSGKVYPLPFTDRIAEKPVDRKWKAIWIENEFIRAMVLPEIGGRIHVLQDKTNGYDVIYNQAGHQARARRPRRPVDFGRHRIQLAAASSSGDFFAGGL